MSAYTPVGLQEMSVALGRRVVNDNQEPIVFEASDEPLGAFSNQLFGIVGKPDDRVKEVLLAARARDVRLSKKQLLASDLYCSSFMLDTPDARLVTLMNALEALLDPAPRPPAARAHVEKLIKLTNEAEIAETEKNSLRGSLRFLLDQSIQQAGLELLIPLRGRNYHGENPDKFFRRTSAIRSRIVHGVTPRPDRLEVGSRAANLELMVGHLLSLQLLDDFNF